MRLRPPLLVRPDRVLPRDGEVRGIFAHLDETQINQLGQMLLVDHPTSFSGDVLQRPSKVNGIKTEMRKRILVVFHNAIVLMAWVGTVRPPAVAKDADRFYLAR